MESVASLLHLSAKYLTFATLPSINFTYVVPSLVFKILGNRWILAQDCLIVCSLKELDGSCRCLSERNILL
ncbi:hypothetical protein CISIN_1g043605mg [Citrus sinensis]|uniref:Uncharacterized protein n=1 Tax=Citrus sinensis TaxID=2711 RepID=A0A067D6E8_CITSI|nr:hypothetical protein CISIN_1g043605mg [Citrus sinensis]